MSFVLQVPRPPVAPTTNVRLLLCSLYTCRHRTLIVKEISAIKLCNEFMKLGDNWEGGVVLWSHIKELAKHLENKLLISWPEILQDQVVVLLSMPKLLL